ncbi:MAG: hypothetical protein V3U57_00235 [Robiginitomaculum sp.]
MTRNLKTRIRKLENREDQKRFTVPEDGLSEKEQIISAALVEIVETRFAQNADHRFAVVLSVEVLERAQKLAPDLAEQFTEETVRTLCRELIAESTGGTVVFIGYPESEF